MKDAIYDCSRLNATVVKRLTPADVAALGTEEAAPGARPDAKIKDEPKVQSGPDELDGEAYANSLFSD